MKGPEIPETHIKKKINLNVSQCSHKVKDLKAKGPKALHLKKLI